MRRNRQRGFSLMEAALAVLVVGVMVMVYGGLRQASMQGNASATGQTLSQRIEDSLVAFAAANGRLPCPSASQSGLEMASCAAGASGKVPYLTLGLPAYTVATVTYTLPAYVTARGVTVNLAGVLVPNVLQVDWTQLDPAGLVAALTAQVPDNRSYALVGLCEALLDPPQSGPVVFSFNGNAGAGGALRSTLTGGMSAQELASRLACDSLYSSSARSYFNVVAAYAATLRNFTDYLSLTSLEQTEADDDLANGNALLAAETIKVAVKEGQLNEALGACDTDPAKCGGVAQAQANLLAESQYLLTASGKIVRYAINLSEAEENQSDMSNLVSTMAADLPAVMARAQDSVAGGNYFPQ